MILSQSRGPSHRQSENVKLGIELFSSSATDPEWFQNTAICEITKIHFSAGSEEKKYMENVLPSRETDIFLFFISYFSFGLNGKTMAYD